MEKLKELRKQNSLTQEDLGKILNITAQAYANYEKGKRTPEIKQLLVLADYYGCSLDYLVEHKSSKQDFGYLTEEQVQVVKIIKSLNQINIIKVISYSLGLLENQ